VPTPKTKELFFVVVTVHVGAPEEAPQALVAPTMEPAPLKLMRVMEDCIDWESVAVTETLVRADAANACHISAVPV
jgi:hypothetical protein